MRRSVRKALRESVALARLEEEVIAEKEARAAAPWPVGQVFPPMLLDVALEAAAQCAVLRRHVAKLTAELEEFQAAQ